MTLPSSAWPSRVFIDSSAYYALLDKRDEVHQEARAIAQRIISERVHLFTSNFVVAEAYSLIVNRLGRALAVEFLNGVDSGATMVIPIVPADEQRAREIIYHYEDKDFSLVDGSSFAAMERLKINTAFAFDRHFAQYGFTILSSRKE